MWDNLKASIASVVRTNGNQEITGENLQNVLNTIVNSVGANATFAGVATPNTSPGTPDGPVFWIATQEGTYTDFGGIVVTEGITILKYNGTLWVKEQVIYGDGGIFDVSAFNDGATYASLEALLSNANLATLIPMSVRKGGMSIKFVLNSNNKYVQWRYTNIDAVTNSKFANVDNWQGVDDDPTAGSENLVKSGGIDYNIKKLSNKNIEPVLGYYIKKNGTVASSYNHIKTIVKAGDIVVFSGNNSNSSYCYTAALIPDDGSDTVVIVERGAASNFVYKVTTDGTLYVNFSTSYLATSYLKFTNPEYELINELYAESGNVTYDDAGNILSYPVKWSSGATGTYTNTDWDAANNMYKGYEITYSTLMKLVQPAVTVSNGKITNIPNKTIIEL